MTNTHMIKHPGEIPTLHMEEHCGVCKRRSAEKRNQRETIDAHMSITGKVLEYLVKISSNCAISIRCISKGVMPVI